LLTILLAAGGSGCGGSGAAASVKGAGSSLVAPLVQTWVPPLRDRGLVVEYNAIGSGGGIQAITTRTVDFGASDAPLTPDQAADCKGCVQIPWALSATAFAYDAKTLGRGLRLTGPVIAGIYLGEITNWSDPRIAAVNPGKKLPSRGIGLIFRSDASGDTYALTSYLSQVSSEWKEAVGSGTLVDFPVGAGGRGNAGVAGMLSRTPGGIGYLSAAYAVQNRLAVASIQNAAGTFVRPDVQGIAAAADAMGTPAPDNSISIVDPPASATGAYPISTFSYAIVPKSSGKARELKQLLEYAIGPGQEPAERFVFAPLPAQVVELGQKAIASIGSG
jgi:phosphate transport system substrate-binding protein